MLAFLWESSFFFFNGLSLIKSAIRCSECCAFMILVATSHSECSILLFSSTSLTLPKVEETWKYLGFINWAVMRAHQFGPFSFDIWWESFLNYADWTCGCDLCFQAKSLLALITILYEGYKYNKTFVFSFSDYFKSFWLHHWWCQRLWLWLCLKVITSGLCCRRCWLLIKRGV